MQDLKQSVLGGMASVGAVMFSNPFDTAKTRLMLQRELVMKGELGSAVAYRHVFHCIAVTAREEGIASVQKGLVAGLTYNFAMQTIRLGLFSVLVRSVPFDSTLVDVGAGFAGGMVGAMVTSPLSLIKVRLQAAGSQVGRQTYNYRGVIDGLRTVYRSEGMTGLYRGVWASMLRVAVGSAAQMASYKKSKQFVQERFGLSGSVPVIVGAAAVSGIVCSLSMNPLDVVSTRMYNNAHQYSGVFDVLARTVRTEGVLALWKGVSGQFSRIVPHTVLTIVFAEALGFDFNP